MDGIPQFSDVEENVSFPRNKNETYDYLPYSQYASPLIMVSIIKEMLTTAMDQIDEKDIPTKCSIEQAIVKINSKAFKIIEKINKHVTRYQISINNNDKYKNMYNIKIISESSTINNICSTESITIDKSYANYANNSKFCECNININNLY